MQLMNRLLSTLRKRKRSLKKKPSEDLSDRNDNDIGIDLSQVEKQTEDSTMAKKKPVMRKLTKQELGSKAADTAPDERSTDIDLQGVKDKLEKIKKEAEEAKDEIIDEVQRIFKIRDPETVAEDLDAISKEIEALRHREAELSGKLMEHLKKIGPGVPGFEGLWTPRGIRANIGKVRSRRLILLAKKKEGLLTELADATRKVRFMEFAIENDSEMKGWDIDQKNGMVLWVE